ncbi:adenosylmethionine decarboxylase [Zoogloea dura]|uniref:adenosylmethionine decarboxylase n=1 Tax=Zoogloea dura TaxID=2728840 RepID=UPI00197CD76B|nr:adenosylmethionine decarboxylase [Zoogloea dura]
MSDGPPHLPKGLHLLADFHGVPADRLQDPLSIETLLREAARMAGATPVGGHFHPFGPGLGVTGVLLLQESHISIHTWPEHGFAAVDVFMCGRARPERAVQVLQAALQPESVTCRETPRG